MKFRPNGLRADAARVHCRKGSEVSLLLLLLHEQVTGEEEDAHVWLYVKTYFLTKLDQVWTFLL